MMRPLPCEFEGPHRHTAVWLCTGPRRVNSGPHRHLRFLRRHDFPVAVIAGPADARQLTHPFYVQRASLLRPRLDDLVDAETPASVLCRRLSLILSKALRKKSISSVLSARADFS